MIKFSDFSKSYSSKKGTFAVEEINLTAENGRITGILGPNGAGKTTLIKAACSVHYGDRGNVSISDEKGNFYNCENCPEIIRNLTGYVPEQNNLPKHLTVCEFLEQSGMEHGIKPENIKKAIKKTAEDFSLSDVLKAKISTLSKGYRQRLSFAAALIYSPSNIILDEPVNGLDPAQIIQFRKLIKNCAKHNAVLISTHLMQEVEALCDYVYIISRGRIAAEGTVSQIIQDQNCSNIEEAFLKVTENKND